MLSFGMLYTVINIAFCPIRYSPRVKTQWFASTVQDRGVYFHTNVRTLAASTLRLDRILANRGGGSRKETLTKIKCGRVKVDGVLVKKPSQQFPVDCGVTVDGQVINTVPLLMAFHKPLNVLSSMGDPIGRPSLLEAVPKTWGQMGLHPVGRLDADTTGLLLFSSNGKLTNELLEPKRAVEREYIATVDGDAMAPDLKEKLALGVETSLGVFRGHLVEQKENTVRLVVAEGKYRMVRRMLANVGLPVTSLHRTRYGGISLEELNIAPGEFATVSEHGTDWAKTLLDKTAKRQARTRQERARDRQVSARIEPQKTEEGFDPTLSTYGTPPGIMKGIEEMNAILPVFKSYTLKSGDWEFTDQEKADMLNESTWAVYDKSFFKPDESDGPVLPPGPIEVV